MTSDLFAILHHLESLVSFDTRNPPRAIGSDGILLGEGLGVVVLKLLADELGARPLKG